MMRFLQTKWTAAAIGALTYALATWFCLQPQKLIVHARTLVARQAGDVSKPGPSWTFQSPELNQLISELKEQRDAVRARASQLDEWQARLTAERQEIYSVTQGVYQLRAELESLVTRVSEEEGVNLKKLAKVYSTMSPEGAARILKEMDDDQVIKIMALMKESDSAPILENLGQGKNEAKRAALISNRLRLTLPPPKKTSPP